MIIVGADYHPAFQQIAFVDTESGDYGERRLGHPEEAETFYRDLAARGNEFGVDTLASNRPRAIVQTCPCHIEADFRRDKDADTGLGGVPLFQTF